MTAARERTATSCPVRSRPAGGIRAALATIVLLAGASAAAGADAATWRFAAGDKATCPKSVRAAAGKIEVDLSALPKGAKVFRAVLRVSRQRVRPNREVGEKIVVVPSGDPAKPLALRAPRYTSLDATAAVAAAVKARAGKVAFQVQRLRGWQADKTSLDLSFVGAGAKAKLPKIAGLAGRHRDGQTILTWAEADPPTRAEKITIRQLREIRKAMAKKPSVAYRIYRATEAITPATIAQAECVDQVGQLTGWNRAYHGQHARYDKALDVTMGRYVVADGKAPVPPGTGVYAHNPARAGKAWYAVTAAIDGEEDFAQAAVVGPIDEQTGPGPFVLQRERKDTTFQYVRKATLRYYVRWESSPRCNLPSTPYDYVVAIPSNLQKPAPLQVALHCWGGSLNGGYGGWHGGRAGGLMIATNQIPYDWWIAYHEHLRTLKPWAEGVCRDFTPKRVLAFLDWVRAHWQVDDDRVVVSGNSMGGAGASMMAVRYPQRFAYALATVGVHNAADSNHFKGSYEGVVGLIRTQLKHESGLMVWDYLSNSHLLRKDPARDMPLLCFGNGKDDHGIGWEQALDFARACQETRQPHTFGWNLGGHTARVYGPPAGLRRDQSVPAFTRCSLDDDAGTATKIDKPKITQDGKYTRKDIYDGVSYGQYNAWLSWEPATVVDEKDRWEATVFVVKPARGKKPPKSECTVDVTPRRCRKFKPKAGEKFTWTHTPAGGDKPAATGQAVADKWGLVTLPKIAVSQAKNRIVIKRQ